MAKVITNSLKTEIMSKVIKKVRAAYLSGAIGDELAEAESLLHDAVEFEINSRFPPHEIEILEKYKCTNSFWCITVRKRNDGIVFAEVGFLSGSAASTDVCNGVKFPSSESNNALIREISQKYQDVFLNFFNISDRIECEIKAILEAYSARLKVGTGIKRLLAEHPGMEEFLPVEKEVEAPESPNKAELILAEFEKSISAEERDAN